MQSYACIECYYAPLPFTVHLSQAYQQRRLSAVVID